MLSFYPVNVRSQFGDEMVEVFAEMCDAAERTGKWGSLKFFLREVVHWPMAVIRSYLDVLRMGKRASLHGRPSSLIAVSHSVAVGRGGEMDKLSEYSKQDGRPVIIVVLPLILLGMGIMFSALVRTDVWYRLPAWQLYLSMAVLFAPGLAVGLIGLLALFKRIPLWGITWVGCAFMGVVLTVQVFVEEMIDEGLWTMPPAVETVLALTILLVGLGLLLFMALRSLEMAGLFTAAVAGTMSLSLLQGVTAAPFNRDDLALLAGPLSLLLALLVSVYIRRPGLARWSAVGAIGLVNTATVVVTTGALRPWLESRGASTPIVPLLVILTGLLLSGPLSALLLTPLRRRRL